MQYQHSIYEVFPVNLFLSTHVMYMINCVHYMIWKLKTHNRYVEILVYKSKV